MAPDEVGGERPQLARERRPDRVEGHPVLPVPLGGPPPQVPALPARRGSRLEDVADQPVQVVPASGPVHGLHEQLGRRELGQEAFAVVPPGQDVGEVRADEVHRADLLEEPHELGRLVVEHLGDQVVRDAVVVAREGRDDGRRVRAALQVQRGQAEPRGPALGTLDELLHLAGVELDAEQREQLGGLVGPERELLRPDLGEQAREP